MSNAILASDGMDIMYADFQNRAKKFISRFNECRHTIKDEQISGRVLNHWLKNGLLEDQRPGGKGWHKFSDSDIIWIKIMTKLRGFGVSIEHLKEANRAISCGALKKSARPRLDFYVAYTRVENKPARLLVFPGGEALIASQSEIDRSLHYGTIKDDFISIDIGRVAGVQCKVDYLDYSKSEIEREIFKGIYDPIVQSITIESTESKYIITSKLLMENKEMALAARQLLKFGNVMDNVHKGKSRFTLTEKKHIKKS